MRRLVTVALSTLVALAAALVVAEPARAEPRNPIVFVHGYGGNGLVWGSLVQRFRAAGYPSSHLVTFSYDSSLSNVAIANQIKAQVDAVRTRTGAQRVDIINHSMGGMSSRYYLKNLGGTAMVDDWISYAGANHGTTFAFACLFLTPNSCGEMLPGSAFLTALNSGDETPGSVSYTTFWSNCDGIIRPPTSTILTGANNINVGCIDHLSMLSDPTVAQMAIDAAQ